MWFTSFRFRIGYRDRRADRESVTFFSAPFRSRTDRTADEGTGVVPIKNLGAGKTFGASR